MKFDTEELALMDILPALDPEIGMKCAILGAEAFREVTIYEIGTMRLERMVRTRDLQTDATRCFTERKGGRWIERGEGMKSGTPLVVGFPR